MGQGMVPGPGGVVNPVGPGGMVDQIGNQMGGHHAPGSNLNRQSGGGQGGSTGSAPELREYNGGNNGLPMGPIPPHMMQQHANQMQQGQLTFSNTSTN